MAVEPTTPVLIGAGTAMQRFDDPLAARDLVGLTAEATLAAAADAAAPVLGAVDAVYGLRGMWPLRDLGGAVARMLGLRARSVSVVPGVLQTSVFGRACADVQAGRHRAVLVVGGEAKYRDLRAAITSTPVVPLAEGPEPDELWGPHGEIISRREIALRLVQATHHYSMIENARRFADGQSVAEHAHEVASLWADFNVIGRANRDAWNRRPMSAAEIAAPGPQNRLLAFPYNKWHNSQWNVDQAGALLFTTAGVAAELGVAHERWIFPLVVAGSEHMVAVSARDEIARSPGFALAGAAALEHAGCTVDEVEHLDLYSCFPIAVRTQVRELGIGAGRPLTVTGGMTWAGGPLNNYVVQSTAKMVGILRDQPAARGMVTAVSGMITKQGVSLWSATPPSRPFAHLDVTEAVRSQVATREVVDVSAPTAARVATYTVIADEKGPARGVIVADLADGTRAFVTTDDATVLASMQADEWCGRAIAVDAGGRLAG